LKQTSSGFKLKLAWLSPELLEMKIIIQALPSASCGFLGVLSSINSRSLLPLCRSKLQSPFLPCLVVLEERKENRQKNPVVFGRRGFWSAPGYIYVIL
jgi:hypothetical protein